MDAQASTYAKTKNQTMNVRLKILGLVRSAPKKH